MIGSSENRISYNGNGSATEFPFPFKILEKTDFDILHDRLSYNDRSGYQIITFDENGDWKTERFLLNPTPHIFFDRPYKK